MIMEYVSKEEVLNLVQEIVHDPNVVHKCRSIRKRINSLPTVDIPTFEYDENKLSNTHKVNKKVTQKKVVRNFLGTDITLNVLEVVEDNEKD